MAVHGFVRGGILVLLSALLFACGGGGGGAASPAAMGAVNTPASERGSVTIALTDAEGDFLSYTVDVRRIELRRDNGDIVRALPASTRVDFAQLANIGELVSVATVPAGNYDEVRLLLDYSNAAIVVQDENGVAQTAAVRDASGNPLTQLDVALKLAERDKIRVSRGTAQAFTIDFDLAASNEVSFAPAVVRVSPLLVATAALDTTRSHRLRGLLESVDQTVSTVALTVRPHGSAGGRFGSATVGVSAETSYEINGTSYSGNAGLAALASIAPDTLVTVSGVVRAQRLQADRVLVGSSVPGTNDDALRGVIISRTGNVLRVRGIRTDRGAEERFARALVDVTVGPNTVVLSRVDQRTLTEAALSVGSSITVAGAITGDGDAARLDATAKRVLVHVSEIAGTVVSTAPLRLDLAFVNGVRPAAFNFAGTGVTSAEDANPDSYRVDTTGLDTASLATGDVLRVRGLANAFAQAPPDFDALSLLTATNDERGAALEVRWRSGGGLATVAASGITLDLTAATAHLHLRGIRRGDSADAPTQLLPTSDGAGEFALHVRGAREVALYRSFAAFTDALRTALDGSRTAVRLSASGQYNPSAGSLTVRRVSVELVTR